MTDLILEKFSQLHTKKNDLISLYHHSHNPKKFNYTTPKEKSDYEYLHKVHQEKLEYITGEIQEKNQNIEQIEKDIKTNYDEYNNLKDSNAVFKDEKKEQYLFDNLKTYEDKINELQELINNYKILVAKDV